MLGIGVAVAAVAPAVVKAEPPTKFYYGMWDNFGADVPVNPRGYQIPLELKGLPYQIHGSGTYRGISLTEF